MPTRKNASRSSAMPSRSKKTKKTTTKSWKQKLADSKDLPKIVHISAEKARGVWKQGTCAIPAPIEVDEIMRKVPSGKVITNNELRAVVARRHHADMGCPITTGIFCWIAANAAEEAEAEGAKRITPYWRTLKSGGELNPKYPGGIAGQQARLEAEGHTIIRRGKKAFVADYEKKLANPDKLK